MKKISKLVLLFLMIFTFAACDDSLVSKKASPEELLSTYLEGIEENNIDKSISIFPEFAQSYYKGKLSIKVYDLMVEQFGEGFVLSFNITEKSEIDEEELKDINEQIEKTFNNSINATKCYSIKGTLTAEGPKNKSTSTLNSILYCDFNGTWRLLTD